MFSQERRCVYQNNQLADVICQLRFPEILSISANLPVQFQEEIRSEFPIYSSRTEQLPPKFEGIHGNLRIANQPAIINYQFSSQDNTYRINLTSRFISLSCNNYTCWEDFAKRLDKPLAAFIRIYKPIIFERIGLRYLNAISRESVCLTDFQFNELIHPMYLGILVDEEINETQTNRSGVDAEFAIRGGCRAKIHAGPGLVNRNGRQEKEVKFIFDQDLSMSGNIPANFVAGAMETLHNQAFSIFRNAITDVLHNAMGPAEI